MADNIVARIGIEADTSGIPRAIENAVKQARTTPIRVQIDGAPLGRITADVREFDKSLSAASARVIAFTVETGVLYGVASAFRELVRATIDVEKQLTGIQAVLHTTEAGFGELRSTIFDIGKDTGSSFTQVVEAVTEFSRQGLSLNETLKRTKDTMILVRQSGLGVKEAIEVVTSSVNEFQNQAIDSTTAVNKLINVGNAFSVTSRGLGEALSKSAAAANESGVSFDQLIAVITSLQQTTGRSASTVSLAFRNILNRTEKNTTLEALEQVGVRVRALSGEVLPAVEILKNLSGVYGTLTDSQQRFVNETVAGVRQGDVLRALLGDIGKEYGAYSRALQASLSTSDEAVKRNEELNTSLSALINKTKESGVSLASAFGTKAIEPGLRNLFQTVNSIFESVGKIQGGDSIGSKIGSGIVDGIGTALKGPGTVLISALLFSIFGKVLGKASETVGELTGLNKNARLQQETQTSINRALNTGTGEYRQQYEAATTLAERHQVILKAIQAENAALEIQRSLYSQEAAILIKAGVTPTGGAIPGKPGKAFEANQGYIPNAGSGLLSSIIREKAAVQRGAGGAFASAQPVVIPNFNFGGGKSGPIVANTNEYIVKNFAGGQGSAIFNPRMINQVGGFNNLLGMGRVERIANQGYVPNFAKGTTPSTKILQIGIPEGLIEEGLNTEYSDIAHILEKYTYDGKPQGIYDTLKHPRYEEYQADLQRLLKRFYGSQSIPVSRVEGYAGFDGRGVGEYVSVSTNPNWGASKPDKVKKYSIDYKDVVAAGNEAEGELIVRRTALVPMSKTALKSFKTAHDGYVPNFASMGGIEFTSDPEKFYTKLVDISNFEPSKIKELAAEAQQKTYGRAQVGGNLAFINLKAARDAGRDSRLTIAHEAFHARNKGSFGQSEFWARFYSGYRKEKEGGFFGNIARGAAEAIAPVYHDGLIPDYADRRPVEDYLVWEPQGELAEYAKHLNAIPHSKDTIYRGGSEGELEQLLKNQTLRSDNRDVSSKRPGTYFAHDPGLAGRFTLRNARDTGAGFFLEADKNKMGQLTERAQAVSTPQVAAEAIKRILLYKEGQIKDITQKYVGNLCEGAIPDYANISVFDQLKKNNYSWLDRHGKFTPVDTSHGDVANRITGHKNNIDFGFGSGIEKMWAAGNARISSIGKDVLIANLEGGASLVQNQRKALIRQAEDFGFKQIWLDNGESHTTIWEQDSNFAKGFIPTFAKLLKAIRFKDGRIETVKPGDFNFHMAIADRLHKQEDKDAFKYYQSGFVEADRPSKFYDIDTAHAFFGKEIPTAGQGLIPNFAEYRTKDADRAFALQIGQLDVKPEIVFREALQNAFAHGTQTENPVIVLGSGNYKNIEVGDIGPGLSPKDLIEKYLPYAVTGEATANKGLSGFGIGKSALFLGTQNFKVTTTSKVGDKLIESVLTGDPASYLKYIAADKVDIPDGALDKPAGALDLHGIKLQWQEKAPAEHVTQTGLIYQGELPPGKEFYNASEYTQARVGKLANIPITFGYKEFEKKYASVQAQQGRLADYEITHAGQSELVAEERLPNSIIRMYHHPTETTRAYGTTTVPILSQGMRYISQDVQADIAPKNLAIDIESLVPADSPDYPWTLDRAGLRKETADKVQQMVANITGRLKEIQIGKVRNISSVPISHGKGVRFADLSTAIPPEEQERIAKSTSVSRFAQGVKAAYRIAREPLAKKDPAFDKDLFKTVAFGRAWLGLNRAKEEIYLDPIKHIDQVVTHAQIQKERGTKQSEPLNFREAFISEVMDTIVHEYAHQINSSEGEGHARAMGRVFGTLTQDSGRFIREMRKALDSKITPDVIKELITFRKKYKDLIDGQKTKEALDLAHRSGIQFAGGFIPNQWDGMIPDYAQPDSPSYRLRTRNEGHPNQYHTLEIFRQGKEKQVHTSKDIGYLRSKIPAGAKQYENFIPDYAQHDPNDLKGFANFGPPPKGYIPWQPTEEEVAKIKAGGRITKAARWDNMSEENRFDVLQQLEDNPEKNRKLAMKRWADTRAKLGDIGGFAKGYIPDYALEDINPISKENYLRFFGASPHSYSEPRSFGAYTAQKTKEVFRQYGPNAGNYDEARRGNVENYLKFRQFRQNFSPNLNISDAVRQQYLRSRIDSKELAATYRKRMQEFGEGSSEEKAKYTEAVQSLMAQTVRNDRGYRPSGLLQTVLDRVAEPSYKLSRLGYNEASPRTPEGETIHIPSEVSSVLTREYKADYASPDIQKRVSNLYLNKLKRGDFPSNEEMKAALLKVGSLSAGALTEATNPARFNPNNLRVGSKTFVDAALFHTLGYSGILKSPVAQIFGLPEHYQALGDYGSANLNSIIFGKGQIKDVFGGRWDSYGNPTILNQTSRPLVTSNKEADDILKYAHQTNHDLSRDRPTNIAKEYFLKDTPFFDQRHSIESERAIIDFLVRNKDSAQFTKQRTAYGAAGQERTFTYLDLAQHLKLEDLNQGAKSSVPRVFQNLNQRLGAQIEEEAKNRNASFPVISHLSKDTDKVKRLMSEAALVEEGKAMGHCVGGYGQFCSVVEEKTGLPRSVIVSNGRATAELNPQFTTKELPEHPEQKFASNRLILSANRGYSEPLRTGLLHGDPLTDEQRERFTTARKQNVDLYLEKRAYRKEFREQLQNIPKYISKYQIKGKNNTEPSKQDLEDFREYVRANGLRPNFALGFIPNFNNPLKEAIQRESKYVDRSKIYVDQDSRLKSEANPLGLLVANKRDEPRGGFEGVSRAMREGRNPQTYGAARGLIPNFAEVPSLDFIEELMKIRGKLSANQRKAQDNYIFATAKELGIPFDKKDGGLVTLRGIQREAERKVAATPEEIGEFRAPATSSYQLPPQAIETLSQVSIPTPPTRAERRDALVRKAIANDAARRKAAQEIDQPTATASAVDTTPPPSVTYQGKVLTQEQHDKIRQLLQTGADFHKKGFTAEVERIINETPFSGGDLAGVGNAVATEEQKQIRRAEEERGKIGDFFRKERERGIKDRLRSPFSTYDSRKEAAGLTDLTDQGKRLVGDAEEERRARLASRRQQLAFGASFIAPPLIQGIAEGSGLNPESRTGRAFGGIIGGVSTGTSIAALTGFTNVGVVLGAAVAGFQSLKAITDNTAKSFERISKEIDESNNKRQQESVAISNTVQAISNFAEISRSGDKAAIARSSTQIQALLPNIPKEYRPDFESAAALPTRKNIDRILDIQNRVQLDEFRNKQAGDAAKELILRSDKLDAKPGEGRQGIDIPLFGSVLENKINFNPSAGNPFSNLAGTQRNVLSDFTVRGDEKLTEQFSKFVGRARYNFATSGLNDEQSDHPILSALSPDAVGIRPILSALFPDAGALDRVKAGFQKPRLSDTLKSLNTIPLDTESLFKDPSIDANEIRQSLKASGKGNPLDIINKILKAAKVSEDIIKQVDEGLATNDDASLKVIAADLLSTSQRSESVRQKGNETRTSYEKKLTDFLNINDDILKDVAHNFDIKNLKQQGERALGLQEAQGKLNIAAPILTQTGVEDFRARTQKAQIAGDEVDKFNDILTKTIGRFNVPKESLDQPDVAEAVARSAAALQGNPSRAPQELQNIADVIKKFDPKTGDRVSEEIKKGARELAREFERAGVEFNIKYDEANKEHELNLSKIQFEQSRTFLGGDFRKLPNLDLDPVFRGLDAIRAVPFNRPINGNVFNRETGQFEQGEDFRAERSRTIQQAGSIGQLGSFLFQSGLLPEGSSLRGLFRQNEQIGASQQFQATIERIKNLIPENATGLAGQIRSALSSPELLQRAQQASIVQSAEKFGLTTKEAKESNIPLVGQLAKVAEINDKLAAQGLQGLDPLKQNTAELLKSSESIEALIGAANNLRDAINAKNQETPQPQQQPPQQPPQPAEIPTAAPTVITGARGYIPNFNAFLQEARDIASGIGGARLGDKPMMTNLIGRGPSVVNTGESVIKNFLGSGKDAVFNRDMKRDFGLPLNLLGNASRGFIPNFEDDISDLYTEYGMRKGTASQLPKPPPPPAPAPLINVDETGYHATAEEAYQADLRREGSGSDSVYEERLFRYQQSKKITAPRSSDLYNPRSAPYSIFPRTVEEPTSFAERYSKNLRQRGQFAEEQEARRLGYNSLEERDRVASGTVLSSALGKTIIEGGSDLTPTPTLEAAYRSGHIQLPSNAQPYTRQYLNELNQRAAPLPSQSRVLAARLALNKLNQVRARIETPLDEQRAVGNWRRQQEQGVANWRRRQEEATRRYYEQHPGYALGYVPNFVDPILSGLIDFRGLFPKKDQRSNLQRYLESKANPNALTDPKISHPEIQTNDDIRRNDLIERQKLTSILSPLSRGFIPNFADDQKSWWDKIKEFFFGKKQTPPPKPPTDYTTTKDVQSMLSQMENNNAWGFIPSFAKRGDETRIRALIREVRRNPRRSRDPLAGQIASLIGKGRSDDEILRALGVGSDNDNIALAVDTAGNRVFQPGQLPSLDELTYSQFSLPPVDREKADRIERLRANRGIYSVDLVHQRVGQLIKEYGSDQYSSFIQGILTDRARIDNAKESIMPVFPNSFPTGSYYNSGGYDALYDPANYSKGFVPNFNLAIKDAIERETTALKNRGVSNPRDFLFMGESNGILGIGNTIDERAGLINPNAGIRQGIDRYLRAGKNPRNAGRVPNYAASEDSQVLVKAVTDSMNVLTTKLAAIFEKPFFNTTTSATPGSSDVRHTGNFKVDVNANVQGGGNVDQSIVNQMQQAIASFKSDVESRLSQLESNNGQILPPPNLAPAGLGGLLV